MTNLSALISQNATNLSFANPKQDGDFSVRHFPQKRSYLGNLFVRQFCASSILPHHREAHTCTRTISIAGMIAAIRFDKAAFALRTQFRGIFFPVWIFLASHMEGGMIAFRQQFKIFYSIILLVAIDMMDNFIVHQWTTKKFTHYKTMLKDIASFSGVWMIGAQNQLVSLIANSVSSLPSAVSCAFVGVTGKIANIHALFYPRQCCPTGLKLLTTAAATFNNHAPIVA